MDDKKSSNPYPQEVINKVLNISITVDELVILTDLASGYIALSHALLQHGVPEKSFFTVHKFHDLAGQELGEELAIREKSWRDATDPSKRK